MRRSARLRGVPWRLSSCREKTHDGARALCLGRLRHFGAGHSGADRLDHRSTSARAGAKWPRLEAGGMRRRSDRDGDLADGRGNTTAPRPRRILVLLPASAVLGLAALFLMQLHVRPRHLRDTVGADRPAAPRNQPAAARRHRRCRDWTPRLCRQGNAGECLGVVVRAVPRGASAAAGACRRTAASTWPD